jgi:hypothetical protein
VRQRLLTQKTTCDSTIDATRHRIKRCSPTRGLRRLLAYAALVDAENNVRQHAGAAFIGMAAAFANAKTRNSRT